jgi:hypothetical protein
MASHPNHGELPFDKTIQPKRQARQSGIKWRAYLISIYGAPGKTCNVGTRSNGGTFSIGDDSSAWRRPGFQFAGGGKCVAAISGECPP